MQQLRRTAKRRWYWLLVIPYVAMLWPPLYDFANPSLVGIPFFYWYQFLWVALSGVITGLVFVLAHRGERG